MGKVFCKGCKEYLYTSKSPKDHRIPFCGYCMDAILEEHWNLLELARIIGITPPKP